MNGQIESLLVVSTGHVPEDIINQLDVEHASMRSEYGLMLSVNNDITWPSLHDNLGQLTKIARENKCCWLLLDCDADQHPDVSVYDW